MALNWPKIEERTVEYISNSKIVLEGELIEVENQISQSVLDKKEKRKSVVEKESFGFSFLEEEEIEITNAATKNEIDSLEEKKDGILKSLRRKDSLLSEMTVYTKELAQEGLHPLAVVPEDFFNKLCFPWLYRFEHLSPKGKTGCKGNKIEETAMCFYFAVLPMILAFVAGINAGITDVLTLFAGSGFFLLFPLYIRIWGQAKSMLEHSTYILGSLLLTMITYTSYSVANEGSFLNLDLLLAGSIGLCFLAAVISVLFCIITLYAVTGLDENSSNLQKAFLFPFVSLMVNLLPKKTLLRMLWPEKVDTAISLKDSENIVVRFNVATDDHFYSCLKKIQTAGLSPCFAVVLEGIVLSKSQITQAILERISNDPILYIKKDKLVAVFSQTGDFTEEKEVMEWIEREGLKMCLN